MTVDKYKVNDGAADRPPYSNRGVQNTYRGVLRVCVDWLQATFTAVQGVQQVYEILGIEKCKFSLQEKGMYGYKTHYKYGHISVLSDGGSNMGVHVQLSGQGCREYESMGIKDWKQLLCDMRSASGRFARIDLAIDDIVKDRQELYFTVKKLVRKLKDGCARSYFKKAKVMESILVDDGATEGQTLYIGKESSDIQIRFYDKAQERLAKGKELEEGVTGWIRSEMQTRRKRAEKLASYIIERDDIGKIASGVFKNYINFLVKGDDANKARWKVCDWWDEYLGDVDKLALTMVAPDRTIERTKAWLDKQIAPSLGMVYMAFGGSEKELATMIADGVNRLTDSQLQLAIDYQKMLEKEKEVMDYRKNEKWQEYMFRSGAHRTGLEKEKLIAAHDELEPDM